MKLAMKIVRAAFLTVVLLIAAFVGVVVVTRPTPVQGPPNCFSYRCDGYAKVISIEPVSEETAKAWMSDKTARGLESSWGGEFRTVRFQYVGDQSRHDEVETNGRMFELVVNTEPSVWSPSMSKTPPIGKEVFYTKQSNGYLNYFQLKWNPYGFATGVVVQPIDPMPWFHNKEKSQGLAVIAGLVLLSLVGLVLAIVAWLVPIYIAKKREHPNFMPIAVLTILLGWTGIGWAGCLAWSLSNIKKSQDSVPEPVAR